MYLQDWVEGPHPLPTQGSDRGPILAALQILQRPDVARQARQVPEYFAEAAALE